MESVDSGAPAHPPEQSQNSTTLMDAGPVALSFPAILRNPKLVDRYAHLRQERETAPQPQSKYSKKDRSVLEGKRWVRRRENAKFTHNPHITPPTTADFSLPSRDLPSSTFPVPLPPYLPRSITVPPTVLPSTDPATSAAGLFSLSLRGARRTLRRRPFTAPLVKAIESHLINWLDGGTFFSPNEGAGTSSFTFPGEPVGGRDDLREVRREAGRLVWAVRTGAEGDGGFERFIVHCIARWHNIVSFSKDTDGRRLTYLLRPNATRPVPSSLDTPPISDVSDFHVSDANTSDTNTTDRPDDNTSDDESIAFDLSQPVLSAITESPSPSRPSSPTGSAIDWSDFDIDSAEEGDVDQELAASIESLSVSDSVYQGPDTTFVVYPAVPTSRASLVDSTPTTRPSPRHTRHFTPYPRSSSSPSPVRRTPRRTRLGRRGNGKTAKKCVTTVGGKPLFYDYLFA
ncbi:hypothetical protein V8B97DRAFT_1865623 [Scleroderma yunnanense]